MVETIELTHRGLDLLPGRQRDAIAWTRSGSGDRYRRALTTDSGGLFEGVGHLQNTEIVAMTAHDLNADGQPLWCESRRNRHRGTECRRDPIGRFHPIDVGRHLDP